MCAKLKSRKNESTNGRAVRIFNQYLLENNLTTEGDVILKIVETKNDRFFRVFEKYMLDNNLGVLEGSLRDNFTNCLNYMVDECQCTEIEARQFLLKCYFQFLNFNDDLPF